jgi:DNA-binding transcriptional MerR regulator
MEKSRDAFRTISEVADLLETPAHVLRFWESRFPQIRPVKRAGGRRYYRPTDVALLSGIKQLLHSDGLTIRGVQKVLREQGIRHVMALASPDLAASALTMAPTETPAEVEPAAPAPARVLPFREPASRVPAPAAPAVPQAAPPLAAPTDEAEAEFERNLFLDDDEDDVEPFPDQETVDAVSSAEASLPAVLSAEPAPPLRLDPPSPAPDDALPLWSRRPQGEPALPRAATPEPTESAPDAEWMPTHLRQARERGLPPAHRPGLARLEARLRELRERMHAGRTGAPR